MSIHSTLGSHPVTAQEVSPEKKFVPAILPWLVAGVALAVYLLTLNHWVSFRSLAEVMRASGWNWQPELNGPVFWLVTLPFRWLPAAAIPVALNLFAAVCAALTLALLVRTVALLPRDRTEAQRSRERSEFALLSIRAAWLPPVLAAVACGLQLTFWENATAGSREIFDVLLLAYVIRCLLEYRLEERESWLFRASLVYGAAMANDWAMVAFFPLFLGAMVWIKGRSFFRAEFLGRMFVLGVAGLSLYLLLPLVNAFSGTGQIGFWPALRANLAGQKQMILFLPYNKSVLLHGIDAFHADRPLWVLGLPTLLPVLLMGIRWPRFFGDLSKLGITLNRFIFHFAHTVFFVVCLWVMLDPEKFSPRHLLPELPLLSLYYLAAISVGYYSGYVLLVFGAKPAGRLRTVPAYMPLVDGAAVALVWVLLFAAPLMLFYRNLPQVRTTNGPMVRRFATAMTENLPKEPLVLLSDDSLRLMLVRSALTQSGRSDNCLFLDTEALIWPEYHRFLNRKHPQLWGSVPKGPKQVTDLELIRLVGSLAQTNRLYYLHPSFGYYFEVFYPSPHGLVYELSFYPTNALLAALPSKELLAQNAGFWDQFDEITLKPLLESLPAAAARANGPLQRLAQFAHLGQEQNPQAALLAKYCSRSLDAWAVDLQRAGQLAQAGAWFKRALDFNPDNAIAQANFEYNANLQAGRNNAITSSKSLEEQFRKYHSWDQVIRENGPFDEPSFCYAQGWAFLQGSNYRQSAQEFDRVRSLSPDNIPSRLLLARIATTVRLPDEALKVVHEIRSAPGLFKLDHTNELQLLSVELAADLAKGDSQNADNATLAAMRKYPGDSDVMAAAAKAYMDFGLYSNALTAIEEHLKWKPNDQVALLNKGNACLQLKAFPQAVDALTQVLQAETNETSKIRYLALFMRAKAFLNTDRLEEAQRDDEILQKALPTEYPVYYDLGEIAYRRKDAKTAIEQYRRYLANAPTNLSNEIQFVSQRLEQLKQASP